MTEEPKDQPEAEAPTVKGFVSDLVAALVRDAVKLIVAFGVGTGAGAIVCWYYGLPMILSLAGGILVLALAVVFMTDGLFS